MSESTHAADAAPTIIDEWTDEREAGALGFRIVIGPDGDPWLEMRCEENGVWSEWDEEDLDGPGADVLWRIPDLLRAERARIRRELLESMSDWSKTVAWRGEGANERQIGAHAAINALQVALDNGQGGTGDCAVAAIARVRELERDIVEEPGPFFRGLAEGRREADKRNNKLEAGIAALEEESRHWQAERDRLAEEIGNKERLLTSVRLEVEVLKLENKKLRDNPVAASLEYDRKALMEENCWLWRRTNRLEAEAVGLRADLAAAIRTGVALVNSK